MFAEYIGKSRLLTVWKHAEEAELPKDVLAPAEGPRENLVVTAIKFLQNPKVRQSPLSQKKAFLEKKGLTQDEIQLAVQRAGVTDDVTSHTTQLQYPALISNTSLGSGQQLVRSPTVTSPWTKARELAMTTAVFAAVSYAIYTVFKTYIQPWLMGKSEAEARLERLETSIAQLKASVAESTAQMAENLKDIQQSLTPQRDRIVQSADIGLRQETNTLNEIKSEISSLKGLLLNRRQFPPPPSTAPIVPSWQKTAVRDEQSPLSSNKEEDVTNTAANVSDSFDEKSAPLSDVVQEKETVLLDASTFSTSQVSEDSFESSQIRSQIYENQSSCDNNEFELLKPNPDLDTTIDLN